MHLSYLIHLLDCPVNLPAFSVGVLECCRNSEELPHVIHCGSSWGVGEALGLPLPSQWTWGNKQLAAEVLMLNPEPGTPETSHGSAVLVEPPSLLCLLLLILETVLQLAVELLPCFSHQGPQRPLLPVPG